MRAEIRQALETHLATIGTPWPTKWEGKSFKPVIGVSYQRAVLRFGDTVAAGAGEDAGRKLVGVFYITAFVAPKGAAEADARADALCAHFRRGLHLEKNGVVLTLEEPGGRDGVDEPDWYGVPVAVPWFSYIF